MTQSGATWSPVFVSYGYNNRTQMLRIPDAGRIEDRTVDGSCNPYLAATAMLAAGLDSIERGLDPGAPNSANLYEYSEAERAEHGIDVLRAALDKTRDGDYVDYYAKVKRDEWQAAHEQITQWKLDRYLQLF